MCVVCLCVCVCVCVCVYVCMCHCVCVCFKSGQRDTSHPALWWTDEKGGEQKFSFQALSQLSHRSAPMPVVDPVEIKLVHLLPCNLRNLALGSFVLFFLFSFSACHCSLFPLSFCLTNPVIVCMSSITLFNQYHHPKSECDYLYCG